MRFRTKLFLSWVVLALGLWGCAFFAIRRSVEQSFNHMADETFTGIDRGLHNLYLDRVNSMRQACQLVANIPELRALIAEQNYELSPENQASLRERLAYINGVAGATFTCALSASSAPVAQSEQSPWSSLADLNTFLRQSAAARAVIDRTFQAKGGGQHGLWVYEGRLYQVAVVPMVFQTDVDAEQVRPEGALIMGKQLTDAASAELGASYGCDISFLADGRVAASSLPRAAAEELLARTDSRGDSFQAVLHMGEASYRAAFEPLIDPGSGLTAGTLVIQQNQSRANGFLWEVLQGVLLTILGATIAAAVASYLLSRAITRPVQDLATGVGRVAQGDLDVTFKVRGRDELAQLGIAFNHMVSRLRESRDELQRLLEEARKGAEREHLLQELAHQINQRLDVQSSLAMFHNSVGRLFPDVELAVFRYNAERHVLLALNQFEIDGDASPTAEVAQQGWLPLNEPNTLERLARHELVHLLGAAPASRNEKNADASASQCSTCLVPMRAEDRLLGAIAATRNRPDGFAAEEAKFLQALADHFAIALANAQVYEELRQAYHELRANQRQIIQSERLRALGQMASGIAHDFNNHLTGVLAFLEMALDRDDLQRELRGWLQMSFESSLAAAEVVKLLRNFYRRDATEIFEPVDINRLASETISLTRPRWFDMPRRHGLVVQVHEDFADVGCTPGNAAELRDALTNLLFNAVDALPQGGDVTVRTRLVAGEIFLEVADTGTGMSDEVRERCLDPYFTTKGSQGTGLGLSMVLGVVDRHHGRLTIDSRPGRGSTIRLALPRAEQVATAAQQPIAAAHDPRRRILCVDDDNRVLKSLEGMLGQMGHDVTTTDSGADAIARIAAGRFDVLITDLGMPGVDGREVARTVKSIAPQTRVLLLSGWADRLVVEGDFPVGVDQILGKPITKAQLRRALGVGSPTVTKVSGSLPVVLAQGQSAAPTATASHS
jgi:signal transduction histidine kinase/ActR/RegA family two-component response regulator